MSSSQSSTSVVSQYLCDSLVEFEYLNQPGYVMLQQVHNRDSPPTKNEGGLTLKRFHLAIIIAGGEVISLVTNPLSQ